MAPQKPLKVYEEGDLIELLEQREGTAVVLLEYLDSYDARFLYKPRKDNSDTRSFMVPHTNLYEGTRRFAHRPKENLQVGDPVCHLNYWQVQPSSLMGEVVAPADPLDVYVQVRHHGPTRDLVTWLWANTMLVDQHEPEPETTSFQPLRQRIPRPPAAAKQLGIPNSLSWKEPC
jgi:hypothetical protein